MLVLAFILSLLAFGQAGCKRNQQETGFSGIVLSQVPDSPPSQVSKGQDFMFMVTLENKGSYDVKPGEAQVFLGGFFPDLFSLSQVDLLKSNKNELRKADRAASIAGGRENIIFSGNARYIGQNVNFDQKVSYRTCYVYESNAKADICFAKENSPICSLGTEKENKAGGKLQGASVGDGPLQITSITEERSGQNILVRFIVENKGAGRVYAPGANCANLEPFLENEILVTVETEEPLDCRPTLSGEKMGDGRVGSAIVCKRSMQGSGSSDHVSPINFKLRYKYVEVTEANLRVTE